MCLLRSLVERVLIDRLDAEGPKGPMEGRDNFGVGIDVAPTSPSVPNTVLPGSKDGDVYHESSHTTVALLAG